MDRRLYDAIDKAKLYNMDWQTLKPSTRKNKRFMILVDGRYIHFGAWPALTYLDHHNDNIRRAWRARHSKILKQGSPAYMDYTSPEYYSWRILW